MTECEVPIEQTGDKFFDLCKLKEFNLVGNYLKALRNKDIAKRKRTNYKIKGIL